MAALSIQVPYPVFYDRDGQPLDNGNIYIGVANLDPVTNPLQVYYDSDLTITASQPLVTSGGYVYRNGTPTQLYVNAPDFSITVNDSKNLFVYSFPEATGIGVNADSIEYDPPFTGAVTSGYTVQDKLSQIVSVKDFGAVGDGVTDDRAAIILALSANDVVYFPPGDYYLSSKITFTTPGAKKLVGVNGFDVPEWQGNSLPAGQTEGTRFLCHDIVGFTFEYNCPSATFSQLEIVGICFDGRDGGTGSWPTNASTTWLGLLRNTTSEIAGGHLLTKLTIDKCNIQYALSTNAIGVHLNGSFWVLIRETRISFFSQGYAIYCAPFNNVATTITIQKSYLNYNQQCFYKGGNVTDVQFYDTVFESSGVAIAALGGKVLLSGCYFENIGYRLDTSIPSTGKSLKNFGIDFGAGVLDTPVVSAINIAYGEVVFVSCTFAYMGALWTTLNPTAAWLFAMGRGSGLGSGGNTSFLNCHFSDGAFTNTANNEFCEIDPQAFPGFTEDGGFSFEWFAGFAGSTAKPVLPYADARRLRRGSTFLDFPDTVGDPRYAAQVEVHKGKLFLYRPAFTTPTQSPVGGQWDVGDTLIFGSPTAGGSIGAVCVTAGTPGGWNRYGPVFNADNSLNVQGIDVRSTGATKKITRAFPASVFTTNPQTKNVTITLEGGSQKYLSASVEVTIVSAFAGIDYAGSMKQAYSFLAANNSTTLFGSANVNMYSLDATSTAYAFGSAVKPDDTTIRLPITYTGADPAAELYVFVDLYVQESSIGGVPVITEISFV